MDKAIYLDTNATTPLEDDVQQAIASAMLDGWGNASSSHSFGVKAKEYVETARKQVAEMIGSSQSEIIFTSGGTEGNSTVLHSFLSHKYLLGQHREAGDEQKQFVKPHFITSTIEHPATMKPLQKMVSDGVALVTYVPVDTASCAVDANDVIAAIQPNTHLITIMMANNETGVIQPIKEIGEAISQYNTRWGRQIYFHTDAAQTIGKVEVDVDDLAVDYLTIVGHKFYGPRIGALYVRDLGSNDGCPLKPLFLGGGQEGGYRAGTENTAMIAGLGAACQLVTDNLAEYREHMGKLRDYMEERLMESFEDKIVINGKSPENSRLPNTCNMSILGERMYGRRILDKCERVVASVGAACHTSTEVCKGSAILLACGIPDEVACNAIRLSVGRSTTTADIDEAVKDLHQAYLAALSESR